jgi:hypothetical protein
MIFKNRGLRISVFHLDPGSVHCRAVLNAVINLRESHIVRNFVTSRETVSLPQMILVTSREAVSLPQMILVASKETVSLPLMILVTSRETVSLPQILLCSSAKYLTQ